MVQFVHLTITSSKLKHLCLTGIPLRTSLPSNGRRKWHFSLYYALEPEESPAEMRLI